ncbi:hypothetical protein FXN63_14205 [Pigmentiphaga aceris]|uniref:Uncharacterized protein n=1 Tax=Pigmentiphaga aceris TaxID=1940612 RepID=A0A5C0AWS8_9BURK|nr:hypothetical protein [Pigmentiphaga aceris]QEI06859.1 hypothetical protein FXN63_14205 [Pigmentiphaga aceris]
MKGIIGITAILGSILLLNTTPAAAWDGPFGLEMGLSLDQIKRVAPVTYSKPTYVTSKVPVPNAAFDDYRLLLTPQTGLCSITAWTPEIEGHAYGDAVMAKFAQLSSMLSAKYGKPSSQFDFLRQGAIWKEPRDWMMSLEQKERTLATFWGGDGAPLPNGISNIAIKAVPMSSRAAMISLRYEFKNFEECRALLNGNSSSGL